TMSEGTLQGMTLAMEDNGDHDRPPRRCEGRSGKPRIWRKARGVAKRYCGQGEKGHRIAPKWSLCGWAVACLVGKRRRLPPTPEAGGDGAEQARARGAGQRRRCRGRSPGWVSGQGA